MRMTPPTHWSHTSLFTKLNITSRNLSIVYCSRILPRWLLIKISVYHIFSSIPFVLFGTLELIDFYFRACRTCGLWKPCLVWKLLSQRTTLCRVEYEQLPSTVSSLRFIFKCSRCPLTSTQIMWTPDYTPFPVNFFIHLPSPRPLHFSSKTILYKTHLTFTFSSKTI